MNVPQERKSVLRTWMTAQKAAYRTCQTVARDSQRKAKYAKPQMSQQTASSFWGKHSYMVSV
jgi:hypothetical protein